MHIDKNAEVCDATGVS